jgi:PAS domain S-box-containing protein
MAIWGWLFSPPRALALHAGADAVTGLALMAIALALIVFFTMRGRQRRLGYLFAALVAGSALTHFAAAYTLGSPDFGIELAIKLATTLIAAGAAVTVWVLFPTFTAAPLSVRLASRNAELAATVEARNAELLAANAGLTRSIAENALVHRDMARAHDLLRGFTDAVPGVIFAKDRDSRMLIANDGVVELLGKARSAFIGKTDAEFLDDPAQAEAVMANDRRVMETGVSEQVEERVSLANGADATWLSTKAPLRDTQGRITGVIGLSVDISARKASEAELLLLNDQLESHAAELIDTNGRLNEALTHRDLLLREVYHRVKNNLQMVDSILVMQERYLADPAAKSALASLRGRIHALGLVHHQLMGSANLRTFDVAPFLRELTSNIRDGGASHRVSFNVQAEPLDVGLDFAIPLGLLVTELVTNALKHAFPGGEGQIDVSLSRNADGTSVLVVSDDGTGYDCADNSSGGVTSGLGTKIITALVSQLKATMNLQSDHGTRAEIHIATAA